MKRPPGLFVALALVAGCVSPAVEDPATTISTPATTSSIVTTTSPTTTTTTTTTTAAPSGPPVGWIAPNGVPLAVTGVDGETIEVLTPCGNEAFLTEGSPLYEVDVVIDPGHGGPVDTGAVAPTGLQEKEINLQLSRVVYDLLSDRGIAAVLTRTADYPIPIGVRSAYSNIVGARALVSIHHNAPMAEPSDVPGVEIFVKSGTPESERLGGLVFDATMDALGQFDVEWQRAPDAGVMTVLNTRGEDAYGMVRLPDAPSALVELGYIVNRAEAELYANPDYVPTLASAVADAIEVFLTSDAAGASLVEGRVFNPNRGVGRDQCIEPDLMLALYPDVVDVSVTGDGTGYEFGVTISSPYDSAERYADAWRIIGDDGQVYGVLELLHDHASEQPFTRSMSGIEIPASVNSVTIQGRDQVYGWGGATVDVTLP